MWYSEMPANVWLSSQRRSLYIQLSAACLREFFEEKKSEKVEETKMSPDRPNDSTPGVCLALTALHSIVRLQNHWPQNNIWLFHPFLFLRISNCLQRVRRRHHRAFYTIVNLVLIQISQIQVRGPRLWAVPVFLQQWGYKTASETEAAFSIAAAPFSCFCASLSCLVWKEAGSDFNNKGHNNMSLFQITFPLSLKRRNFPGLNRRGYSPRGACLTEALQPNK